MKELEKKYNWYNWVGGKARNPFFEENNKITFGKIDQEDKREREGTNKQHELLKGHNVDGSEL